jgi:hypothetical protein
MRPPTDAPLNAQLSPGLARQSDAPRTDEDDALAETLRWLAARRRSGPDKS